MIIFSVIAVIVVITLLFGYVKAKPDLAFVISGIGKKPRYLVGKAGMKIPFFERKDELSLTLIPIDVKTSKPVPTLDFINVNADAVVNIKIGTQSEKLDLAAQHFLNQKIDYIAKIAKDVLEGNMREIIGTMDLKTMVNDRQAFAERVKENAVPDLAAMGLEIVSFNVQNFTDEQGAIENLGIDNLTKIRKEASIAKAINEKEIAIAQAKAVKEANDAEVEANLEIEKKNNELAIRKAELKQEADIKRAEADAAYQIQEQEQRKTLEITTANANIAKQEKAIEMQEKEIAIKERTLDANIKKQADADKYAAEKKAEALFFADQKEAEADMIKRQRNADADRYEKEQFAEAAKASADAQKYAAEKEAEAIRLKGEAEAAAIKAKAEAEAAGILKKAEAQRKMGDASKMEMLFAVLPDIVKNAAAPLEKVDKITMYGEGNQGKMVGDIMTTVDKVSEGLGLDLKALISGVAGGFIQSSLNKNEENAE